MTNNAQYPWEQFKRPFVRDLAFALACPDILKQWQAVDVLAESPSIYVHSTNFWDVQFKSYANRLHELDTTTAYQDLTRYLMSRPSPYRLGFHFEGLVHFWLADGYRLHCHPYQVLAHNIQLYKGQQTTGELDFIIHNDDSHQVEHWELAVKFYLGSPPYTLSDWVGINSRDYLQRKIIHMQTKPFTNHHINVDCYEKINIDKRYAVMKGRFFYPSHLPFQRPKWLNDSFPLHVWHSIKHPQDFNDLNMPQLRPAHYIEWMTHRPFYDASFLLQSRTFNLDPLINKNERLRRQNRLSKWPYTPLAYKDIDTNLYFHAGEPLVLVI